jgi:protocatechuate 3,4-dioxygenase alpha subunit
MGMSYVPTGSQTVGPFFNFGLTTNLTLGEVAAEGVPGERIRLAFRVLDGAGQPAPGDAMIELWHADAEGRYAHPADPRSAPVGARFHGFGRLETDLQGQCAFDTIKPGCVPGPNGSLQAPHINVLVFARGLLKQLYTRVYFDGDPANAEDPVLSLVPESRRATLIAKCGPAPGEWVANIVLQGEDETAFFDL